MNATSQQVHPSRKEFLALARTHTLVPVCRRLMADLETPVSAFLRAAWPERECFLLESVEGGEQVGRYTFIGFTPFKRITARGREITITESRGTSRAKIRRFDGDIFAVLRDALSGHKPARLAGLPPFTAGAVGFFAYDAVRQIERLPMRAKDELGIPDACLLFFDEVLAFDHVRKEIWLVVTANVSQGNASAAYGRAVKRLNKLEKHINLPLPAPKQGKKRQTGKLKVKHRTPKSDFLAAVARTKEYIRAGDVFQAVLSQRFDVEPGVDSFQIYRALRTVNPSPYMFFLRFDPEGPLGAARPTAKTRKGLEIAGSSPELLVRVHQGKVEYRPIAGTRRRGATETEDNALAEEMMHDEKERAEHVMLVDLGRNDLGSVCTLGSVRVGELMQIERYSHVMHIVSDVVGELREGCDGLDLFAAGFPAGTVTGTPKIRAMQIVDELEPVTRGYYAGSIGRWSYGGDFDSCITLRSVHVRDGYAYWQASAGIVADSLPEFEYDEVLHKTRVVREVLGATL